MINHELKMYHIHTVEHVLVKHGLTEHILFPSLFLLKIYFFMESIDSSTVCHCTLTKKNLSSREIKQILRE